MKLDQDSEELIGCVRSILEELRKKPVIEMVLAGIPIGTLNRLRSPAFNPLSVNLNTICRVAKRLDQLDGSSHERQLMDMICRYIDHHINIRTAAEISRNGMNYKTLRKFRADRMDQSFHLSTLVSYAEKINQMKEVEG